MNMKEICLVCIALDGNVIIILSLLNQHSADEEDRWIYLRSIHGLASSGAPVVIYDFLLITMHLEFNNLEIKMLVH